MELELITTGGLRTDCRDFERHIEVTSMSTNFFPVLLCVLIQMKYATEDVACLGSSISFKGNS